MSCDRGLIRTKEGERPAGTSGVRREEGEERDRETELQSRLEANLESLELCSSEEKVALAGTSLDVGLV